MAERDTFDVGETGSDAMRSLLAELREVAALEGVLALLDWDQATLLPSGGEAARGHQLAVVGELVHARRTSAHMNALLAACSRIADEDSDRGALVRRAAKKSARAAKLPSELVRETKSHAAATYVAWTKARPADDFRAVEKLLERALELALRTAEAYGYDAHPLDALIEESDEGARVAQLVPLFDALGEQLRPLVRELADRDPAPPPLRVPVPVQLAFSREVAAALGYDFDRGRIDLSPHPFMTRLSGGDVRITTRVREDDFCEAFFSTVHEVGHALYEQGIASAFDGTPLGEGASAGIHESQSRFWENLVARSRPFWSYALPKLRAATAGAFDDVSLDRWVRSVNRVSRSLVRTDADEVTYNLHVAVRFELERRMFEGSLRVAELPEAFREAMQRLVGVAPTDDRDGVLQDVHWYGGALGGGFQGYTLGNLFAAQLAEAAREALPTLDEQLAEGDFSQVLGFLRERVHRHGARYSPDELVLRATGKPLGVAPLLRHLESRHGLRSSQTTTST